MYNQNKKIAFIAVPKTGTGSIRRLLRLTGKYHAELKFYQDKNIDDFFKFTFFRNSWSRAVSSFHFGREIALGRILKNEPQEIQLYAKPTFSDYIKHINSDKDLKKRFKESILFRTQLSWIDPHMDQIDFIGRFEKYDEDLNYLIEKFGFEKQSVEKKLHSSRKSDDWKYYYDDESAEIVGDIYKEEIQLMEYKF